MTSRSARRWFRRATSVLVCLSVTGMALTGLTSLTVDSAAAAVTVPRADLLDVDFADGVPADRSPSARPATTIGTPEWSVDPTLNRSLPLFNEDAGAGNGAVVAGDADGYTYNLADAYAAGTITDGLTFECTFRTNSDSPDAGENEICGDKYSGGFGFYLSANSMTLRATVYGKASSSGADGYQTASAQLEPNTWYDAVAVWNGSTINLYLDGLYVSRTAVVSMTAPALSRQVMTLGGSPSSATTLNYRGRVVMAGSRLWSKPLTKEQVRALALDAEVTPAISGIDVTDPAPETSPHLAEGRSWPGSVRKPNVLDVNYAGGNTTDTVHGTAGIPSYLVGINTSPPVPATVAEATAPTTVQDSELDQQVLALDGSQALAYPTGAWEFNQPILRKNALALECVFRLDSSVAESHTQYPCGNIYSGGAGLATGAYAKDAATTSLQARIHNGAYVDPSASIKLDTWYQAVQTWDGENVKLYLNGKLAAMSNLPGSQIGAPAYRHWGVGGAPKNAVGDLLNSSDPNATFGRIASARVWGHPLTDAEIASLYTLSGVPAVDGGTSGPGSTTVPAADVLDVDLVHGDPVNHVTGASPFVFGEPRRSTDTTLSRTKVTFDGDDAYAYDLTKAWGPTSTPTVTKGFTIECYFRVEDAASTLQKVCSGEQTGGFSVQVPANSTTTVKAEAYIAGGYKSVTASIPEGAWNHIVYSYDGTAQKLYVNGVLKAFGPQTGTVAPPGGTGFVLGADTAGSYPTAESWARASIAAARVWSSALTDEQVALLYAQDTSTVPVPEADVLDVDFHQNDAADFGPDGREPEVFGVPAFTKDPTLDRPVAIFDGDKDAVTYDISDAYTAGTPTSILNDFTIQCDFRYDGSLPAASEANLCSGKESGGYSVNVSGNAVKIRTCVESADTCLSMSAPVTAGVWTSLVATLDDESDSYSLYIDGKLAKSSTVAKVGFPPKATPMGWALGADINALNQPQSPAPASLSAARIWSKALSAEQISALYAGDLGQASTDIRLVSSSPAAGSKITSTQELEVKIKNQDQATGWSYLLDGTAVQPGSTIGGGLAAGDHTLTISAVDHFGAPISFTVPFTSTHIPAGQGTEVGQGKGEVKLSAVAVAPDGGEVTTTFHEATASVADGGTTGTVTGIPTTLDFTSTGTKTLTGAQTAGDGESSPSIQAHDLLPYQRFDVAVPDGKVHRVRWSGAVDPARQVALYAWDLSDQKWIELASARGNESGQAALEGEVRTSMVDTGVSVAQPNVGVVHVLAVASDPFADDLSPRDGSNANSTFDDPADYDFSFVHWTDPQFLAEGAVGGQGNYFGPAFATAQGSNGYDASQAEQKVWASAYNQAAQWTADNVEQRKIAYAANTGDIINTNLRDPADPAYLTSHGAADGNELNKLGRPYSEIKNQIDRENDFAVSAFEKMWNWRGSDGKGMVSQLVAGNHDNRGGADSPTDATSPTTPVPDTTKDNFFNESFTADSFYDQVSNWPAGASFHTIDEVTDGQGKVVTPGIDTENNYVLFSAGGLDFVAVGLSYGVTTAEAEWANQVFKRYPDRNGILITHGYLSSSSKPDGRTAGKSSDGARLYSKVVAANSNVFLVLAGHVHGVGTNLVQVKNSSADITHKTVELLADYQDYRATAAEAYSSQRCETAGLNDVWNPETNPGGTKCKVLSGGKIDVDGDGTADHNADDSLFLGASFVRLLEFDKAASTMTVRAYSPFLDEFGAGEHDPLKRYNGSEDSFTVPVDLNTRMTSFATDGLAVLTPSADVIGTATAKSGFPASVTWDGLVEGQTYAWTATSTTGSGAQLAEVEQFGGLFTATKAGTDKTAPVLTVPGNASITVGDDFDPLTGAGATDDGDDLTAAITVTGSVDVTTPGSYPLLYSVADANGNLAQAQRVVTVKAAPVAQKTATSVTVSNQSVTFNALSKVTAKVSPAVAGTVTFYLGEDEVCAAPVKGGAATCSASVLATPGAYVAQARFTPADRDGYESSAGTFVLTVAQPTAAKPTVKAKATVSTRLKPKRAVGPKRKVVLIVKVSAPNTTATGKVRVKVGKKTVRATLVNGTATVKLGRFKKPGKKKVVVRYSGDGSVKAASTTTSFKVKRKNGR